MEEQGEALPDAPTEAPPGSAEKITELARLAERGESLWHPQDSASSPRVRKNGAQHVLPEMRGIKWRRGAWVVSFRRQGRQIYVGAFREYDEAARALEKAKRQADSAGS